METVLETEDLILRSWMPEDIEALAAGLNDMLVAQWLAFVPHPYQLSDAADWIRHCRGLSIDGARRDYEFAIMRKLDGAVIGGVSLNGVDMDRGVAGGGIWISAGHQNRGFGRQAFGARIRFAFDVLNLREIRNGYFAGNDASWDLQKRFGYRRSAEPPVRRLCLADGSWKDEILTVLSREDFVRG